MHRIFTLSLIMSAAILTSPHVAIVSLATADDSEGIEFFERKIRPVLVEHCYQCHAEGTEGLKGGLRLDTGPALLNGGDSGPAITPGDPESSLLIEAIRYEGLEMPPSGRLSEEVIADFSRWIEMGAPDPRDQRASPKDSLEFDFQDARKFWSFQRPANQRLPVIANPAWARRRGDIFVAHHLEAHDLSPAQDADQRTLVRRVHFDLTGLPPTFDEVESYRRDNSPDAYDRVADRLLASPQYGERWARMWLDVARYAEDQAHIVGSNKTLFYPNAFLYRDWVIDAFNRDLPFDQFVKLQLAADLVESPSPDDLPALGFIGLGPKYYRRNSPAVMADEWEDRVDTVARGLLGLTVACARCHDHKFDPLQTEDYYALAGTFASTQMFNRPVDTDRKTTDDGEAKDPVDALHIVRDGKPIDLNVLIRGDVNNRGPVVRRRFLRILCDGEPPPFEQGSGRLELADAIASPQNPLTARVLVNRLWMLNFGKPLVGTPSNFGSLGDRPSHPQLLDDLAVRFTQSGWSVKWLQREMILSSTYRQSSQTSERATQIDPDNRWLSHMNRRRLDIESWRDSILAVTGQLEQTIGGESIDPSDEGESRRTVYSYISRLDLNPVLAMFDFPDPNAHSARRAATTTPLQKLFVLNGPFMVHQAEILANRILESDGPESDGPESDGIDREDRIRWVYGRLYGRSPQPEEMRLGLQFLESADMADQSIWSQFAQVLLASNEMFIID